MSKQDLAKAIEVKSLCSEDWDEMEGNDKIRFCKHCATSVNNVSAMTRKEAVRLVHRSEGRLCIRYIPHPVTNKPLFSENLYKIARRATGLAAGVMTASISLSTAVYAQGEMKAVPSAPPAAERIATPGQTKKDEPAERIVTPRILGAATDAMDAVIAGARVSLFNEKSGEKKQTTTNADGSYQFEDVPVGTYRLEFSSTGFRTKVISSVKIAAGDEAGHDVELNARLEVGMAGEMVVAVLPMKHRLSKAVDNGNLREVKDLITRHADVNAKEKGRGGITPLFLAVDNGNLEIAEVLLRFGARVNARDDEHQTPLMRLDGDATADLVDLLVKYGAQVDLADDDGNTALIFAADDADAKIVKALVDAGADVDHQNNEGETALMKAAAMDDVRAVRVLLVAGASADLKNSDGETAWDLTADEGVEKLLEGYGGGSGDSKKTADETVVIPVQPLPEL